MIRNKGLPQSRPCAGIASRTDQPSGCCGDLRYQHYRTRFVDKRGAGKRSHALWSLYEQNPQQALPNTNNMLGYLAVDEDMQGVPEQYRSYGSGFLGGFKGRFGTDFICK